MSGGVLGRARAEHGDHAALAVAGLQAGLVHEPAAQRDELQALALIQRAGGDQRAELAQRVARHERLDRAAEGLPAGQAGAEDRRLGEVGALVGARERVLADGLDGHLQQVGPDALHEVAHVRRLAPLAGEQDCACGTHRLSTYAAHGGRIQPCYALPPFWGDPIWGVPRPRPAWRRHASFPGDRSPRASTLDLRSPGEPPRPQSRHRRPGHRCLLRHRRRHRAGAGRAGPRARAGGAAQGPARRAGRGAAAASTACAPRRSAATSARRRRASASPPGSSRWAWRSTCWSTTPALPPTARFTRPTPPASSSRCACSWRPSSP